MVKSSDITLRYGERVLSGFIPQQWIDAEKFLPLVLPPKNPAISDPAGALGRALAEPVGESPPFRELVKRCFRGGTVAILVDDYTRPNDHTRLLLPHLVRIFQTEHGIPAEKITVVVCTGTHRFPTGAELKKIAGETMTCRVNIVSHDCDRNLSDAGEAEGRPVKINRDAFESDLIVGLTDVDNHYFAGVAGGPKSFCPGICDRETITFEHLRMFSDTGFARNVALGVLDGNPVFECKKRIVNAILAARRRRGRETYCLAAIIDPDGDLVYLEGGEIFAVHRAAAEKLTRVWTGRLREPPDVVVSGAGPLGINLYQAGKAIHAAYTAVKRGSHILAVAPCPDRFGNEEFKKLMKIAHDELGRHPDRAEGIYRAKLAVLEAVRRDFKIGKQKAVDLFRVLQFVGWGHLHLIEDGLTEEDRAILPFAYWGDRSQPPEERLKSWVLRFGKGKTIAVIDNPGYVVETPPVK